MLPLRDPVDTVWCCSPRSTNPHEQVITLADGGLRGGGTVTSTRCRPGSPPSWGSTAAARGPGVRAVGGDAVRPPASPPAGVGQRPHVAPVVLDRQRGRLLVPHRGGPDDRRLGRRRRRVAARPRHAGPRGRARLVVLPPRDQSPDRRDRLSPRRAAERGVGVEARVTTHSRRRTRRNPDDDAIERFAERLDRPPLVLHARHIAPEAPDVDPATWWVDLLAAHPHDPAYFRRWFDDAGVGERRASSRTGCSSTGSACGRCGRRPAGRRVAAGARRAPAAHRRRPVVVHGHTCRPDRGRRSTV